MHFCSGKFGYLAKQEKKNIIAKSSAKVEFRAIAHGICEILWLQRVLKELQRNDELHMKLYCDNKTAISIAHNPVQHNRLSMWR